jgi:glycosyltransferase involved in cell wall biosynthesis
MPFSSSSGKKYIADFVRNLPDTIKRKPVLDIGVGSGTYSNLFKGILTGPWTGVEAFQPYVDKYALKEKYDFLQIADVRDIDLFRDFGVCFLGDILEHMSAEDARDVLNKATATSDFVIVSIPIGYYPQDAYEGNDYEIHVTDNWSVDSVIREFGKPRFRCVDREIGVFIYAKDMNYLKPKIAVYAISKNESQFVDRFCNSAKDADYIVIADTGSTDNTIALAKEHTQHVYSISIQPWRFDNARNASLALVPADADICICLDLDEVLEPGWREEIEAIWVPGETTRLSYKFDWGAGVIFFSDKIHARNGYVWHHPCHELLRPKITESWIRTEFQLITHYPDNTKSRGSYLELLALGYKEDPTCTRNSFYYGRELIFRGCWAEAIEVLNAFLKLDGWFIERAYAMRLLGKAYRNLGDMRAAEAWYIRAIAEDQTQREPLCDLAEFYNIMKQWDRSKFYATEALKITDRQLLYTVDPDAWGYKPYDILALAEYYLGNFDEAVKYGTIASSLSPDERLKNNLNFYIGANRK